MKPSIEYNSSLSAASSAESLPKHLIKVPGEKWAFWKWVCLRGAGFPSNLPQRLAVPEIAASADSLLSLEQLAAEKIREIVGGLRLALDNTADEGHRRSLHRALKQLNKGKVPDQTGTSFDQLAQEVAVVHSQAEQAKTQFVSQFQSGVLRLSGKVRELACDEKLRRAVLLQNRSALRRVAHSFSSLEGRQVKRGFKERQNEELIAGYLQRYCLKNDTIGFFGPVGWAKLVSDNDDLAVRPGPSLISKSAVYFENWCIESLAQKMAAAKSLKPWMRPRLLPFFRIDGSLLRSLEGGVSPLPPLHAAVLQRCDGEATARDIARAIMGIPECSVKTEGQVYGVLQAFVSRGAVSWTFEIPYCLYPEKKLRDLLERVENDALRRSLLDELDELERQRAKISLVIDDAEQLDQALDDMDAAFTRLTGRAPTKSAGEMYAARTLTYQDCRRDVNVEIGPNIIAALGDPLALLLTSARWFSHRAAAAYRDEFRQIYGELAQGGNVQQVELLQFWAKIEPLIFDPVQKLFNRIMPEFQSRWEEILRPDWNERQITYTSANLKPLVENAFSAPGAGWQLARYHSPDVMIAAPSIDSIRRGDYMFVLGEIHMANNTVRYSFAVSQHGEPRELLDAIEADLPESRLLPVPPRHWPRMTNRTALALISQNDYHLEVANSPVANGPRSRTVPISAFIVEESEGKLIIRNRNTNQEFDVIEFLGEILSGAAVELMKIVRPRPHVPRIVIDKLVVTRESWSFAALELDFIHPEAEHERYLRVRRWMRVNGLPRFVFVRVPVEVKPFYLDFESPIYVEIFIKMVRRMLAADMKSGVVTLSEMLPTPEQAWLPDAEGQSYTSELRMVAWDLAQ
jgi:hypothetical protein